MNKIVKKEVVEKIIINDLEFYNDNYSNHTTVRDLIISKIKLHITKLIERYEFCLEQFMLSYSGFKEYNKNVSDTRQVSYDVMFHNLFHGLINDIDFNYQIISDKEIVIEKNSNYTSVYLQLPYGKNSISQLWVLFGGKDKLDYFLNILRGFKLADQKLLNENERKKWFETTLQYHHN